jgi:hypothetical protein
VITKIKNIVCQPEFRNYQDTIADITVMNDVIISELNTKIIAINDLVYQLRKDDTGKGEKIIALQIEKEQFEKQILKHEQSIESLKTELALTGEIDCPIPDFIDQSQKPYLPYLQFTEADGKINGCRVEHPQEMYAIFDFQKELIKKNSWRFLPKYKKIMAMWTWLLNPNTRVYAYDYGDNWQTALQTYYRKKCDCEDGTILFVSFCRALGIRPDEVFNAVGPTSVGYHSYPIVYLDEHDIKESNGVLTKTGWYIFETTINGVPSKPRLFENSNYWIDSGGIQNWKFAGLIKSKYNQIFNVRTGVEMSDQKILNDIGKIKKLQEDWEEKGEIQ